MSHNIEHYTYPYSQSKKTIESKLAAYVEHACWEEGGHLNGIRWIDSKIYDSESAAREAIKKLDKGWYDCLAVPFRQADMSAEKIRDLQAKECAAWYAYNTANSEVLAKSFKSQLIGCKSCGSKLNKDFLKSNRCPLCGTDMRSPTELQRIARLKAKAEAASNAKEAEERKMGKKSKDIFWLVKIEYHT